MRSLPTALHALVVLLPSLAGSPAAATDASAIGERAPGSYIWVGDHRLHLDCRGAGSPTVVFDSGLGGSSLDWALVQPEVARFTRACAYDRAGYAWSDPGPMPRNANNIVRDLEQLLGNASVAAPYVLVGHSLGGLIAQHYARRNPQRTAGIVLVDATHENQFRRLEEVVRPAGTERWSIVTRQGPLRIPGGLPEEIRRLAAAFEARPQSIVVSRSELSALQRAARAAPAAPGRLPDVPLVVVSHRVLPTDEAGFEADMAAAWMEMQVELAALAPRSMHVIAATDDHYVHVREPEVVIDAVQKVVEEHRIRAETAGARATR